MQFLKALQQFSIRDVIDSKNEEVVETTSIRGLYWIRNYALATTAHSRIVLPTHGQGVYSIVYHANDFSESDHGGYEYYGLHVGQSDVLTFLATDGRAMKGDFVDCRAGSPTLHRRCEIEFNGDPDKALVIDRGIAHIFDNLIGMITLNQMKLYVDYKNPDFNTTGVDVINIPRGKEPSEFPVVRQNRFLAPGWVCRTASNAQRLQLKKGLVRHPFKFKIGEKTVTLTPLQ